MARKNLPHVVILMIVKGYSIEIMGRRKIWIFFDFFFIENVVKKLKKVKKKIKNLAFLRLLVKKKFAKSEKSKNFG